MDNFELDVTYFKHRTHIIGDFIFIPTYSESLVGNETIKYYKNNKVDPTETSLIMVMEGLIYFASNIDGQKPQFHRIVKPAIIQKHSYSTSYGTMYGALYQWMNNGKHITHDFFDSAISNNINPFKPTEDEFNILKLMWFV